MKEQSGYGPPVHYALGNTGSGLTLKYDKQYQKSVWISQ